ncbi:ATP-binding cassette domain-containing protein [Roseomonas sp. CCTCC AB2023176]|uniref:ATP-binding cassette domain-containing protein n=1 Tax=Roseomonas sp. CCTCC AB2023176 TaxID=3342640 RepID=UPI0035DF0E4E
MRLVRNYLRVLSLLKPQRGVVALLCLANLGLAGIGFLDPILFGRVIELLGRSVSGEALFRDAAAVIAPWAALGLIGIGAGAAVSLLADRMAHRVKLEQLDRFYGHVLALPQSFHAANHSGGVMRVMHAGLDTMFGLWLGFFREQLVTLVSVVVLLPLTLWLNPVLAAALLVLAVVFAGVTALVVTRTEGAQSGIESFHTALASNAGDAVANVTVVQSFGRLLAERRRAADLSRAVLERQFPILGWWALVHVLSRAASTIAVLSIVVLGALLHSRGQATVGEIVAFMGFAGLLIGRLEGLVWFVSRLFSANAVLESYFAILDERRGVADRADAVPLAAGPGVVRFEDVAFAYPGGDAVLSGVSLEARPGTVTALVGPTGAGKSTAMALLQRLWDPTAGRVTLDGQDLRDVTLGSLRDSIGVVFQDAMLFNRSIRENLLVGRPDATQEEIEHACRLAEAHDFILRQPQGYDTLVGERGATLSGGQKQRLAIARALLKNPRILILDEATSALDAATEARVGRALATLMAGRTTFVIAHRLSTIRDADEILVFDGGRIAERGDFADLVSRDGVFAGLVASQITIATAAAPAPAALQDNHAAAPVAA